ncbi:hypothetical protein [Microcoleus sp. B4-D4]
MSGSNWEWGIGHWELGIGHWALVLSVVEVLGMGHLELVIGSN